MSERPTPRCQIEFSRGAGGVYVFEQCSRAATTERQDHGLATMRPVCTQHAKQCDRHAEMWRDVSESEPHLRGQP